MAQSSAFCGKRYRLADTVDRSYRGVMDVRVELREDSGSSFKIELTTMSLPAVMISASD